MALSSLPAIRSRIDGLDAADGAAASHGREWELADIPSPHKAVSVLDTPRTMPALAPGLLPIAGACWRRCRVRGDGSAPSLHATP